MRQSHHRTIIEMPASAWTTDRSPSDMFIVTDWPTSVVSVESRFISSPVLFMSKNAISCRTIDEKSWARRLRTMRLPWQQNIYKLWLLFIDITGYVGSPREDSRKLLENIWSNISHTLIVHQSNIITLSKQHSSIL